MQDQIFPRLKNISSEPLPGALEIDLVTKKFLPDVEIFYLLDTGPQYEYITTKKLVDLKVPAKDLHRTAVGNLRKFASSRGAVQKFDAGLHMVTGLEGFESSLLLLPDRLGDFGFDKRTGCLGVPLRDVLLFCAFQDERARAFLGQLTKKTFNEAQASQRVSSRLIVAAADHEAGYVHA